jgi:hypothetical protein
MKPTRSVSRRSFLSVVAGGAVLGTAAAFAGVQEAEAQHRGHTGITNNDPNDPVGHGRSRRRGRSGLTDRDPGDPVGNGRGHISSSRNCTDSDYGSYADPSGRSRFCRRR